MFPRLHTVFASRWNALWFAGMTMLLAYCAVPGDQGEAPADPRAAAAEARAAIAGSELSAEERARAEAALKAIEALK